MQRGLRGDALPAADARDAWRRGGLVCDTPDHLQFVSALDLKDISALSDHTGPGHKGAATERHAERLPELAPGAYRGGGAVRAAV